MHCEREKCFPITIKQQFEQSLKKKKQWIIRWKDGICHDKKRSKVEAASKTLLIWKYFTHDKKPNSPVKRNRSQKSHRKWKEESKQLYDQTIFALPGVRIPNNQIVDHQKRNCTIF